RWSTRLIGSPHAIKPTSFGSAARSMVASATFYSCHASWWTSNGVRRSYGRLPRRLATDLIPGLLNLFVTLAFGTPTACRTRTYSPLSSPCKITPPPNQSMKPTAPLRNKFGDLATTPCRGLSLCRRGAPHCTMSILTPQQLEKLLPLACAWAVGQERAIVQSGVALSESQLADARRVGVAQPER